MQALNRLNQGLTLAQAEQPTNHNNNNANNSNSNTKSSALNTSGARDSFASNPSMHNQLPKLGDMAAANSSVIEQCDYRYDFANMLAYEQQRSNQVNSSGVVVEQGPCTDTTKTFDLVKTYGAPCSAFITTDKAYQSYRITGVIDGEDKVIKGCQADLDNEIAIITTSQGCNTIDNINTMVATAELLSDKPTDKQKVLILADEFVKMGKMTQLIKAPDLSRGQKLAVIFIMQSLSQPAEVYGTEATKTLISTTAFKVVFTQLSAQTMKEVSKIIGTQTIKKANESRKNKFAGGLRWVV